MRIDILAIGSQGDVQPNVALGRGLMKAGHQVRMVTLGGFEDLIRGSGLGHLAIGASLQEIATSVAGRDWVEHRGNTMGFVRGFVRVAAALIESGIASYWKSCRDPEALIASPIGLLISLHIAERLHVPLIQSQLAPRHDWRGYHDVTTAVRTGVNAFAGALFRLLVWNKLRNATNVARRKILQLPPLPVTDPFKGIDFRSMPILDAYSPAVVPRPSHWERRIHVTGYWFLDDARAWAPPQELVDFLKSGSAPVFVGFGSTPFPAPKAATDLIVRALTRAGQRGVVVAGGSGLTTGRLTDSILSIDAVPHDWLFPQVCAAVHHGGAGVTGAVLRAGLPSVGVPVFADQPFWAQRVFELGAAAPPIPATRLTEDRLANAIRLTANTEMRHRAAALGERISREDGVARAVEAFNEHVDMSPIRTGRGGTR